MKCFSDLHKRASPLNIIITDIPTETFLTTAEVDAFYQFARYIHMPKRTIDNILVKEQFREILSLKELWKTILKHRRDTFVKIRKMRAKNPYRTNHTSFENTLYANTSRSVTHRALT